MSCTNCPTSASRCLASHTLGAERPAAGTLSGLRVGPDSHSRQPSVLRSTRCSVRRSGTHARRQGSIPGPGAILVPSKLGRFLDGRLVRTRNDDALSDSRHRLLPRPIQEQRRGLLVHTQNGTGKPNRITKQSSGFGRAVLVAGGFSARRIRLGCSCQWGLKETSERRSGVRAPEISSRCDNVTWHCCHFRRAAQSSRFVPGCRRSCVRIAPPGP